MQMDMQMEMQPQYMAQQNISYAQMSNVGYIPEVQQQQRSYTTGQQMSAPPPPQAPRMGSSPHNLQQASSNTRR